MGDSIVPGTEDKKSVQQATAVIEFSCTFKLPGADADAGAGTDAEADADVLPTLKCDGGEWTPDPTDPENLPKPEDLFDVHLAD